jgi:hypothetical protein
MPKKAAAAAAAAAAPAGDAADVRKSARAKKATQYYDGVVPLF